MSTARRSLPSETVTAFVARVKAERLAAGQAATITTPHVYAALRSAVRGATTLAEVA